MPEDEKPEKTRLEKLKLLAEVVTAVLAVVALVGGGAKYFGEESLERQDAQAFFQQHWVRAAISDPERALQRYTTSNFRQLGISDPAGFKKHWGTVRTLDNVRVGSQVDDQKNNFPVEWVWRYKNGKKEAVGVRLHLVCGNRWKSHNPLVRCGPEDILLDDSVLLGCKYPVSRPRDDC